MQRNLQYQSAAPLCLWNCNKQLLLLLRRPSGVKPACAYVGKVANIAGYNYVSRQMPT